MLTQCSALKEFTFPSNLKTIGFRAFAEAGLVHAALPSGFVKIDGSAFFACKQLKSIYIPVSVQEIGDSAFETSSLCEIYYEGNKEQWAQIKIGAGNQILKFATFHENAKA